MRKFFDKLMNAFGKSNQKDSKRNLQLEPLEERQLLSADPIMNPMGDFVCDPVKDSKLMATAEVDASVGLVNRNIYLDFSNVNGDGFYYMKVDADGVDFKGAQITNITDGQQTSDGIANYSYHDKYSGNTDLIIVQLNGGAKYKVSFTDTNNAATSGQVGTLSVSLGLIGDQAENTVGGDADSLVSDKEAEYVTGAIAVQALQSHIGMSGPGYLAHEQIVEKYGLTYTDFANNYDKFDFNLNGTVDAADYTMAKANTAVTGTWVMTDDDQAPAFQGIFNLGNSVNGKFYVEDTTVDGTVNNAYFGDTTKPNTYADAASSVNAYAEFKDISTLQVAQVVLKDVDGNILATIDFKSDTYKGFLYQTPNADAEGFYSYRFDLGALDLYTGDKTAIASAVFTVKDDADNEVIETVNFKITSQAAVPEIYVDTIDDTPVTVDTDVADPSSSVPEAGSQTPINLSDLVTPEGNHIITIPGTDTKPTGEEYPDASTLIYAIKDPASVVYKSVKDDSVITDPTGLELGKDYYAVYTSAEQTAWFDKTGAIAAEGTENHFITYTYSVTSNGDLTVNVVNDSAIWLSTYKNATEDWTKAALPTTIWVTNGFNYAKYPAVDEANGWSTGTFNLSLIPANDAPAANNDAGTLTATTGATKDFDLLANDTDPDASDTKTITIIDETSITTPIYFMLSDAAADNGVYSLVAATDTITSGIKMSLNADGTLKVDLIGNPFSFLAKGTEVSLEFGYTMADAAGAFSSARAVITVTNDENATPVANAPGNIAWTEKAANQTASLTATDDNVGDALHNGDTLTASILVNNSFTVSAKLGTTRYTAAYDATDGHLHITDGTAVYHKDGTAWKNAADEDASADQAAFFNKLSAIYDNQAEIITLANEGYTISQADGTPAPAFELNFNNGSYFDFLAFRETAEITFDWKVNDGTVDSSVAKVAITVTGENDAPVLAAATDALKDFDLESAKSFTYSIAELKAAGLLSDADINNILSFASVASTLETDEAGKVTISGTGDYASYKNVIEISFNDANDIVTLTVSDYDTATSFLKWGLADGEEATLNLNVSVKDNSGAANDTSEVQTYAFTFIGQNDNPVIAAGQSVSLSIDLALESDNSLKSTDVVKIQLDKGATVNTAASTIVPGDVFSFDYKGTTYQSTDTFDAGSAQESIYNAIVAVLSAYKGNFSIGADGSVSVADKDAATTANDFVQDIKAIYTANIVEEVKNLTNITFKAAAVSVTDSNTLAATATVDINVVEKLPPVVTGDAALTTTNEDTDPAEINLEDYFDVAQAKDDQSTTRTDWYKYQDVQYESATFAPSSNTVEKDANYVTDFIANELAGKLTGKVSITDAGVVTLDITDAAGNIFDFLDEGSSITMTFSAKIYDKEYSVYSTVTFDVKVTGVSDAVKNADVSANINDVFTATEYVSGKNTSVLDDVSFKFADELFALIDWAGNAARYNFAFDGAGITQDATSKANVYEFTAEELATIEGLLVINSDGSVSAKSDADAAEISKILQKIPMGSSVVLTWNLNATNKTDAAEVITSSIAITVWGTNQAPTAVLSGESTEATAMKDKGWTVTSEVTGDTPKSADISVTEGAENYTTTDTASLFSIADIDEKDTWTISIAKQDDATETFEEGHTPSYDPADLITVASDGKVTFAIGNKFDNLRAGESVVLTYDYTVTDANGLTATGTFTLTVNGKDSVPTVDTAITGLTAELEDDNDAAVVVNDSTSTAVGANAGFNNIQEETFELNAITVSDIKVDGAAQIDGQDITAWLGITAADLENLALDASGLKLDLTAISDKLLKLNKTQVLTYTITYGVKYGETASTETQSISVTVTGTNQEPTATGIHDTEDTLPNGWSIESDAESGKVSKVSVVEGTQDSYTTSYKSFGSSDVDYQDVYTIQLVADIKDLGDLTITAADTARQVAIGAALNALIGSGSALDLIDSMIKTSANPDSMGNTVEEVSIKDIDFSFLRSGESISFVVGYHLYNDTNYNATPNGTFTFEIKGATTAPVAPVYAFDVVDTASGSTTATPADVNTGIAAKDAEDYNLTYSINAGTPSFKIYDATLNEGAGGYADATEVDVLALIKQTSVTWGDVLKVNTDGEFEYNGTQLKWLAKDAKIQIEWSIKATSENTTATDGTYTLTVTGTATPAEIAAGQDVTLVTANAEEPVGSDYAGFIKGETFAFSCDNGAESSYTFTATDDANIKLKNNGDGTVTVYVKADAVGADGAYEAPTTTGDSNTYNIPISYNEGVDTLTSDFDLVVTNKSAPAIDAAATASGTENGENISVDVTATDPDGITIDGGWSFEAITADSVTNISDTNFTAAEILAAITMIDQGAGVKGTIVIDMSKFDKLAKDAELTFTLSYTVKDNQFGLSTSKTLAVTITGINDAPTANATATAVEFVHDSVGIAIADLAENANFKDVDLGDSVNTSKIMVLGYASTDATGEASYIDLTATTNVWIASGTDRIKASLAGGVITLDFTDKYYSLTGSASELLNVKFYDQNNATTDVVAVTVTVTGDYVAPEFTAEIHDMAVVGSTRITVGATVADTTYYTSTAAEVANQRDVETVDLKAYIKDYDSVTGKVAGVDIANFRYSFKVGENTYTSTDGEITIDSTDAIHSLQISVDGILTVKYMSSDEFSNTSDLADLSVSVNVWDSKVGTTPTDSDNIILSLKEKKVIELKAVATNAVHAADTANIQTVTSQGTKVQYISGETFDGLSAVTSLDLTDSMMYMELWLKDNTDLYFNARVNQDYALKYTFSSVNIITTFKTALVDMDNSYYEAAGGFFLLGDTEYKVSGDDGCCFQSLSPIDQYVSRILKDSITVNPGMDGTAVYLGNVALAMKASSVSDFTGYEASVLTKELANTYNLRGGIKGYLQSNGSDYLWGSKIDDCYMTPEFFYSSTIAVDWSAINGIGQSEMITDGGIYVRTVTEATETNDGFASSIGANADYVTEWTTHFAEIWVKVSDLTDLSDVSVDFKYDNNYFNAKDVEIGEFFASGDYTINEDGSVTGITGHSVRKVTSDGYVLLARVKMECVENGGVAFEDGNMPFSLGWSLENGTLTNSKGKVFDVALGQTSTTELWAVSYDTNDDGYINTSDYDLLKSYFNTVSIGQTVLRQLLDFNNDGYINTIDYDFLKSMFNMSYTSIANNERTIQLPNAFTQRYIGSTLQTEEDSAWVGVVLNSAQDAWSEIVPNTDVNVTIFVKDLGGDDLAVSTSVTQADGSIEGVIYLDDDAMGNTWYAGLDSDVEGSTKYDLYTVLLHELGHIYGYEHAADESDLMFETLTPGTRKTLDDCSVLNAVESEGALIVETSLAEELGDVEESVAPEAFNACLILENQDKISASKQDIADLQAAGISINNIQPKVDAEDLAAAILSNDGIDEDDEIEILGSAAVSNNDLALSSLLDEEEEDLI